MAAAEERAGRVERAVVDLVEARLLEHRVGELFTATAVDHDARGTRIQLVNPPVRARLHGDRPPPLGEPVAVRLVAVDPAAPALRFQLA
jgi:exoribonuclease R